MSKGDNCTEDEYVDVSSTPNGKHVLSTKDEISGATMYNYTLYVTEIYRA